MCDGARCINLISHKIFIELINVMSFTYKYLVLHKYKLLGSAERETEKVNLWLIRDILMGTFIYEHKHFTTFIQWKAVVLF